jgi:hypothetical protein
MLVVQKMYRLRLDRFVGVEIIRLGVYRSLIEQNQRKREPDDTSRDVKCFSTSYRRHLSFDGIERCLVIY